MTIKFPIFVKPPQSGKTKDAIIEPMKKSLSLGRVPVIILPSRIQLQKQTTKRLIDEGMGLSEANIGRFDTGTRSRNDWRDALDKLSRGTLRVLIVLNNSSGMVKLLRVISKSDKLFDIIIDEIHGFFNVDYQEPNEKPFWANESLTDIDVSTRMSILFGLLRTREHTLSGTTATVSYVAQSKLMKEFDLVPIVVKLRVPDCYQGYDNIPKKIYSKSLRECLNNIIAHNPQGTITMCHVDRKQEKHYETADWWIDLCLANGVPRSKVLSIVDNGDGYTLFNWAKVMKKYDKSKTSEPWRLLDAYKNKFGYTHIGIFGDRCMSESNTYQKCSGDINCPINDLVVAPFNHSLDNMTIMIQKIGRIFGNDTIGGNRRTIWFPKGYKDKLDMGLRLDELIQSECNLAKVNYHRIKKSAKATGEKKGGTKIARFRASLEAGRIYSKDEILGLLSEYRSPEAMLHSFCKRDNFAVHLLEKLPNGYRLL